MVFSGPEGFVMFFFSPISALTGLLRFWGVVWRVCRAIYFDLGWCFTYYFFRPFLGKTTPVD